MFSIWRWEIAASFGLGDSLSFPFICSSQREHRDQQLQSAKQRTEVSEHSISFLIIIQSLDWRRTSKQGASAICGVSEANSDDLTQEDLQHDLPDMFGILLTIENVWILNDAASKFSQSLSGNLFEVHLRQLSVVHGSESNDELALQSSPDKSCR